MSELKDTFLDQTLGFWGTRTGEELEREDARQMIENVSGVFGILQEWAAREKCGSADTPWLDTEEIGDDIPANEIIDEGDHEATASH